MMSTDLFVEQLEAVVVLHELTVQVDRHKGVLRALSANNNNNNYQSEADIHSTNFMRYSFLIASLNINFYW